MTVFICNDETDDVWCAIYDAWMSRLGHKNVRIEPSDYTPQLFCDYQPVVSTPEKARKVVMTIREKLSESLFEHVYKAALSQDRYRADKIYRFLILAFHYGVKVLDMMAEEAVFEVYNMVRNLGFELEHLKGFTRFSETREQVLLGKIGPKNDLTVLLAAHFADRLSGENWILYDEPRQKAAVHQADRGWVIVKTDSGEWEQRLNQTTDEEEYRQLWRAFHEHIAIKERTNRRCQMNMLPLRFRPYMLEFADK